MNLFLIVAWLAVLVLGARQWADDVADGRTPLFGGVMVFAAVWALADPVGAAIQGLALGALGMVVAIASIMSGGWS
jgi:hypothetical protein